MPPNAHAAFEIALHRIWQTCHQNLVHTGTIPPRDKLLARLRNQFPNVDAEAVLIEIAARAEKVQARYHGQKNKGHVLLK
jgi:hypothetical protein